MTGGKDGPGRIADLARQAPDASTEFEVATLRLDRRSADGKLPASEITLTDVVIAEYGTSRGSSGASSRDQPIIVKFRLGVGGLSAEGRGKDTPDAAAIGTAVVTGGKAGWTPLSILAWHLERDREAVVDAVPASRGIRAVPAGLGPPKIRATIPAGPNLKRLSEAIATGSRFGIVYTTKRGEVMELQGVLIEHLAGSSRGPAEIDLVLVAEQATSR